MEIEISKIVIRKRPKAGTYTCHFWYKKSPATTSHIYVHGGTKEEVQERVDSQMKQIMEQAKHEHHE